MARILHATAVKDGSFGCLNVANRLLSLCVKSQKFDYARKLFDEMLDKDVRSWTILISGFSKTGCFRAVVELFKAMQAENNVRPNEFTLSSVLRSCSVAGELGPGKAIHGWTVTNGVVLDATLENALLDVYVKCGEFRYAERLFGTGTERDTVAWNIMIDGHMRFGGVKKSVALFNRLPFRDVASWNTMIHGLMRNGQDETALELLREMVKNGPSISEFTLSSALVLASALSLFELGRQVHCLALRLGLLDDGFVTASLVDFYGKCGHMDKALLISRETPVAESVIWSSLISGHARNNECETALEAFISMIRERVGVDGFTVAVLLSRCCSAAGSLSLGQQIHGFAHKTGQKLDAVLASSLLVMYAKCGSLRDSWKVFEQTRSPNVVVWSSMISALALHGKGLEAVELFERMTRNRAKPNEITFIAVLTACSRSGMVEQGCKYFHLMRESYHIKPGVEVFTCMVDLFGRAGRLDEAKEFINEHGISRLSLVMKTFLSSCRIHNDVEMAKWASQYVDSSDAGSQVLVANMYASRHRWEDSAKVRRSMQRRGVEKLPSRSRVQR